MMWPERAGDWKGPSFSQWLYDPRRWALLLPPAAEESHQDHLGVRLFPASIWTTEIQTWTPFSLAPKAKLLPSKHTELLLLLLLLLFWLIFFPVYFYFLCNGVLPEHRAVWGCQIPWYRSYRQLWAANCGFWELTSGALQEQQVLWATEPSLQLPLSSVSTVWSFTAHWKLDLYFPIISISQSPYINGSALGNTPKNPSPWEGTESSWDFCEKSRALPFLYLISHLP